MFDPREAHPPKQEQACVAGVDRAGEKGRGPVARRRAVQDVRPRDGGGPALQGSGDQQRVPFSSVVHATLFSPTADAFLSSSPVASFVSQSRL